MKLSPILIPATASLLLAGCNSLDNPVSNLFHGMGRDERVYNAQTGQWEWPADKRKPTERKSGAVASAQSSAPAPHSFNDTRYWDPARNQWVEAEQPRSSTPAKPKPAPVPSEPIVATTTQQAPPPPPPRPSQATGVYNPSTGKIDWQTSDANVPRGAVAPPPPKKRWYWPF